VTKNGGKVSGPADSKTDPPLPLSRTTTFASRQRRILESPGAQVGIHARGRLATINKELSAFDPRLRAAKVLPAFDTSAHQVDLSWLGL